MSLFKAPIAVGHPDAFFVDLGGDSIDILGARPDNRPERRPNYRPESQQLVHELPLAVVVLKHGPDQLVSS